jgi:hypothetical protein
MGHRETAHEYFVLFLTINPEFIYDFLISAAIFLLGSSAA